MAEKLLNVELSALERAWIVKSLNTQRAALSRSLKNEIPGSDISRLRSGELQQLTDLLARFGHV